jgi:hypothetical protein
MAKTYPSQLVAYLTRAFTNQASTPEPGLIASKLEPLSLAQERLRTQSTTVDKTSDTLLCKAIEPTRSGEVLG